jgi:hypothetical protein
MMHNRGGAARGMRACFGVAVGALTVVLAVTVARAGDDQSEQKGFLEGMFSSIGGNSDPPIDYRERSPLVVPPKLELPPPEDGTVEKKTPAWPVDAAVKRRQLEEAARRKKVSTDAISSTPVDENGKPVGEDKFREFSKIFGLNQQEKATFKAEPPRTTLVEPPPGYRTPSPDQPYGIGVKKAAEQKTEQKGVEDRPAVPPH